MMIHPQWNPVALQVGPLGIHWYGLTYLLAFLCFVLLARLRIKHEPYASMTGTQAWTMGGVEDLLFYGVLGVILGGRLGYCAFYKPLYYLSNPEQIAYVWQGGMSFHGGMIGVILAMVLWAKKHQKPWLEVTDLIAPCVPTGLASGRMGNFINGELWGREADPAMPWSMVFPQSGTLVPRHPSQIYEFLLEGLLLFVVLWVFSRKKRARGAVSGLFLIGYAVCRFTVEYFREPDSFLGLLVFDLSMGQLLCLPMLFFGLYLMVSAKANQHSIST